MAGIQKAKREATIRKVLEAAVKCVEEGGLDALQAREIAARAGYSVGSVYKYYEDIDDIVIHVNSTTLGRIRESLSAAIEGVTDPVAQLKALARAYLDFARDNRNLWRALFSHHLPDEREIPEWHRVENVALLAFIGSALARLDPGLGEESLEARTRTCFAAVHGVVMISLEQRFVSLSGTTLEHEMDFLVDRLAGVGSGPE